MIHIHDEETIIAQCTPQGSGAIALLRLSGSQAVASASRLAKLSSGKSLQTMPTHTIHHGWVIDSQGSVIDEVLFFLMRGPRTFTGQDTVEITCHNNQFIVNSIILQAIAQGARLAQEGEFSKRAVLSGKIDLIQAEAINELIHAQTQQALKQSLAQLEGTLSSWVSGLEQELLRTLAYCEASFEFLDEEMTFDDQIRKMIAHLLESVATIKKSYDTSQHIRQGVRIAIIGTVNAGKSSLFNALLGKERAIVTPIAGTTRDVIEAGVYREGIHWTLIDTAGLRQADDEIEREGIRRSFCEAQQADIILLVHDASRVLTEQEAHAYDSLRAEFGHKMILVYNKVDDEVSRVTEGLPVSTKTGFNLDLLENELAQRVADLFSQSESPFLLNARHHSLLEGLEQKLLEMAPLLQPPLAHELLSVHLNDALAHLGELTGKTVTEAGMDKVFHEFCVGK